MSELEIKKEFVKIVKLVKDPYAVAFAQAGLLLSGTSLRVQVRYVLNNLQMWRGKEARKTKHKLKLELSKEWL